MQWDGTVEVDEDNVTYFNVADIFKTGAVYIPLFPN